MPRKKGTPKLPVGQTTTPVLPDVLNERLEYGANAVPIAHDNMARHIAMDSEPKGESSKTAKAPAVYAHPEYPRHVYDLVPDADGITATAVLGPCGTYLTTPNTLLYFQNNDAKPRQQEADVRRARTLASQLGISFVEAKGEVVLPDERFFGKDKVQGRPFDYMTAMAGVHYVRSKAVAADFTPLTDTSKFFVVEHAASLMTCTLAGEVFAIPDVVYHKQSGTALYRESLWTGCSLTCPIVLAHKMFDINVHELNKPFPGVTPRCSDDAVFYNSASSTPTHHRWDSPVHPEFYCMISRYFLDQVLKQVAFSNPARLKAVASVESSDLPTLVLKTLTSMSSLSPGSAAAARVMAAAEKQRWDDKNVQLSVVCQNMYERLVKPPPPAPAAPRRDAQGTADKMAEDMADVALTDRSTSFAVPPA